MIDLAFKESCRDRIVEIIEARVPIKKTGAVWAGLCPFHPDQRPSLSVSPKKKLWRCWACSAGGDAIDFVQKFHGVGFMEAMRILGAPADARPAAVAPAMRAMRQIDRDADALLAALEAREKKTILIFQHVGRQLAASDPLERKARWYTRELICYEAFDEIGRERDRIEDVRRRHKNRIRTWKA